MYFVPVISLFHLPVLIRPRSFFTSCSYLFLGLPLL
jgi:hypothetical protein